jgi:pimeloyl-ACP methyl ester carboxylesterase
MTAITANGIRLEYEGFGDPADPALVLVIGFGLQLTGWPVAFCEGLAAQGFHVIRFDNRDTGLSEKFADHMPNPAAAAAQQAAGEPVDAPYSQTDMAADVAGLITALGLGKAHVVGMSMGGMITQRVMLEHPELVRSGVVMMSSTNDPSLPQMDPATRTVLFSAPDDPADPESVVVLGLKIFNALRGSGFESDLDAYAEQIRSDFKRSPDLLGYARNLVAGFAAAPLYNRVNGIAVPTLVLHGDEDPLFPVAVAEQMTAVIPGASLRIVEGWGHEIFAPSLAPVLIEAIAGHCSAH